MASFGGQHNTFGGGGHSHNNSNNHNNNNSRGGGGRSNYRGGRGRGRGRNSNNSGGRGGSGGRGPSYGKSKFQVCKNYATNHGQCNNNNCSFAHVVQRHGLVPVTNNKPNDNNNNHHNNNYNSNSNSNSGGGKAYAANTVTIWETNGNIKIFTGSDDGYWRLWNTSGGNFVKEFESNMNGPVTVVKVVNEFLFCGFESVSTSLPEIPVGMVHVWNLNNASAPPMELQHSPLIPYAHNQSVTALDIATADGAQPTIVSGSRDGSIRVWTFSNNQFQLVADLAGHAREVTGLVFLPSNKLLWSCAIDGAIRIWDVEKKACQYCISSAPPNNNSANAGQTQPPQTPPNSTAAGPGHTNAVTCLIPYASPAGTFILSSSLDGTIKAWNATTGECVASEANGEGVVCMVLATDGQNNQILLAGTESGAILLRALQQTPKVAAFGLLCVLTSYYNIGHYQAPCNAIVGGPQATFYTVGSDGKLLVCQFTGDLQLN